MEIINIFHTYQIECAFGGDITCAYQIWSEKYEINTITCTLTEKSGVKFPKEVNLDPNTK